MIPNLIVGLLLAVGVGIPVALIGVGVGVLLARWEDKGRRCINPRGALHPIRRARTELAGIGLWEWLRGEWAEIAYVERELRHMLMEPFRAPRPAETAQFRDDIGRKTAAHPETPPAGWDEIAAGMEKPSDEGIAADAEVREEFEQASGRGTLPLRDCCMALESEPHTLACPAQRPAPMSPDSAVVPFTGWQVPDNWRLPGGRDLMFARPGKPPWLTGQQPAIPVELEEPAPSDPGDDLGPLAPIARPWTADQVVYNQASQLTVDEAERKFALALAPDGQCEETT